MYLLLPHHVQQAVLSDDDIAELVIEQARLRARISDVDLLTDKDRKALAAFFSFGEPIRSVVGLANFGRLKSQQGREQTEKES